MKEKVQRDWGSVRDELNVKLSRFDGSYSRLSNAANIGYFAARRFLINGATNQTNTAKRLCSYFGVQLDETAKPQSNKLNELTDLVAEVWDGSGPHAELLAKLIQSTRQFKVQGRSK